MLSNMKNQISGDQCDWDKLNKQFKRIFGEDSRIYINKTESKLLQIIMYKLPHYIYPSLGKTKM